MCKLNLTFQLVVTNEEGMESEPDSVTIDINPSNSPSAPPPFEGIVGSGNNVNIQIQENSGHNSGGQSGDANLYLTLQSSKVNQLNRIAK